MSKGGGVSNIEQGISNFEGEKNVEPLLRYSLFDIRYETVQKSVSELTLTKL